MAYKKTGRRLDSSYYSKYFTNDEIQDIVTVARKTNKVDMELIEHESKLVRSMKRRASTVHPKPAASKGTVFWQNINEFPKVDDLDKTHHDDDDEPEAHNNVRHNNEHYSDGEEIGEINLILDSAHFEPDLSDVEQLELQRILTSPSTTTPTRRSKDQHELECFFADQESAKDEKSFHTINIISASKKMMKAQNEEMPYDELEEMIKAELLEMEREKKELEQIKRQMFKEKLNNILSTRNQKVMIRPKSPTKKPESSAKRMDLPSIRESREETLSRITAYQQKIIKSLEDIEFNLIQKYETDGTEEIKRRMRRETEFGTRFSRNYLYQIGRILDEIKFTPKANSRKLVADVHTIYIHIYQALQSYGRNMVNFMTRRAPEKLDHFLNLIIAITNTCTKRGVFDSKDELISSVVNQCYKVIKTMDDMENRIAQARRCMVVQKEPTKKEKDKLFMYKSSYGKNKSIVRKPPRIKGDVKSKYMAASEKYVKQREEIRERLVESVPCRDQPPEPQRKRVVKSAKLRRNKLEEVETVVQNFEDDEALQMKTSRTVVDGDLNILEQITREQLGKILGPIIGQLLPQTDNEALLSLIQSTVHNKITAQHAADQERNSNAPFNDSSKTESSATTTTRQEQQQAVTYDVISRSHSLPPNGTQQNEEAEAMALAFGDRGEDSGGGSNTMKNNNISRDVSRHLGDDAGFALRRVVSDAVDIGNNDCNDDEYSDDHDWDSEPSSPTNPHPSPKRPEK